MQGKNFVQTLVPLPHIEEAYGISKSTIYKAAREKGLKIYHLFSKPFIKPEELEACMEDASGVTPVEGENNA